MTQTNKIQDKIKYITITLGQQGGIGYPPMIVKIGNKWFAIEDSRYKSLPDDFYDFLERDKYHCQGWALRKFRNALSISTEKLIEWIKDNMKEE